MGKNTQRRRERKVFRQKVLKLLFLRFSCLFIDRSTGETGDGFFDRRTGETGEQKKIYFFKLLNYWI